MKTVLHLSLVFFSFLSAAQAAPKPKVPLIYITTKFIEVSGKANEMPVLPAALASNKKTPRSVGTFTDPQFQVLIRELSQRKGVDLLSAPSVTTKPGQQATVEVVRQLPYKDEAGHPASIETGVTFSVLATLAAKGQIVLDLTPKTVELDRYVKHKNGWEEPIFITRKANRQVVLTSGHTFVLEMAPKTDTQTVEEADRSGRVISSRVDTYTRRSFVFVTAKLLDSAPANKPVAPLASPPPAKSEPVKNPLKR